MVKAKKEAKGGAKVKVKETDAEKKARLEMEMLRAEEDNRRKEEASRVKLRKRQLKEEKYAVINAIKIHNQWRKIMRLAKVEDLRKEIEILSQNHEREVDRKDAIIQMLDRDLEDAEEQYQMALRSHLQTLDALIDLQYTRVKRLEEEFNFNLHALEEEFDTERTEIVNWHVKQKKDMQDIMAAMEQEFEQAEAEARQEFESQREEIKNRNSEEYNVLKISLESTIEELERHFESAHQAYLATTDTRTTSFRQLTERDADSAKIIEKRMRKLIRLQDSLAHWRTKIATNNREWEERNRSLRNEKDIMARHYQELKGRMNKFRNGEGGRLKALSIQSGAAIKELERKMAAAERILKLAELNRKLETEMEKVMPFRLPADAEAAADGVAAISEAEKAEAEAEAAASVEKPEGAAPPAEGAAASPGPGEGGRTGKPPGKKMSSFGTDGVGSEVEEWDYLNVFFTRFNKVLLDHVAIRKERMRLDRENGDLRSILKQYLDGISVNEDVMNNPSNPLMVVNNKLQLSGTGAGGG
eukprot:CAMPEP_0182864200 /NCGR_PEP_ID=MMETSP0034_2-20130328/7042_1 /TAXON_ID=156128 /ORGANISM="Nephroselmis pyriformis, Strain CCMP717" /LENGTH=528 /DNA_ID=CAMNT_0024996449 /DNA_START=166 /DNA_END=1749 /DNA_ORIENTATION=+